MSRKDTRTFLFLGFALVAAAFWVSQDALAGFLWRNKLPAAALFLVREDADLAFAIGNRYFGGGVYDLPAAEWAYRKARQIDPQLLGPRYQLSRIEFLKSDFQGALALVNEEIALHPDFKRSYYIRGLIRGYAGDFAGARADFEEFLRWDETSWAAHNDLAWVLFMLGDYARAEETARAGLRSNPGNAWLLLSRGAALLNLDKAAEAERVLVEAELAAAELDESAWGRAYPGNDPAIYGRGLEEMRQVIRKNLELARSRLAPPFE